MCLVLSEVKHMVVLQWCFHFSPKIFSDNKSASEVSLNIFERF